MIWMIDRQTVSRVIAIEDFEASHRSVRRVHDFDFLDLDGSDNILEGASSFLPPKSHLDVCRIRCFSDINIAGSRGTKGARVELGLDFRSTKLRFSCLSFLCYSSSSRDCIIVFSLVRPAKELPPDQSRRLTWLRLYWYVSYRWFRQGLIALHVSGWTILQLFRILRTTVLCALGD